MTNQSEFIRGQAIQGGVEAGPRGRKYATTLDGKRWTKSKDGEWVPTANHASKERKPEDDPLQLFLVLEGQVEGEPNHWSLFVSKEGQAGTVYQVTDKQTFPEP